MRYLPLPWIFVLSLLYVPLVATAALELRFEPVGVDGKALFYLDDFNLTLYGDGQELPPEAYRIIPNSSGILRLRVAEKKNLAVLQVNFDFISYHPESRNVKVIGLADVTRDMGVIKPRPYPIMIADIRYFAVEEDMMEFEVTFRNNEGKEVLVRGLDIGASVQAKCNAPSPIFAKVEIAREVKYFTDVTGDNLRGVARENDRRTAFLQGSVLYHECGSQSIDLRLPLATVVPAAQFSKMIIRLPNSLRFYETNTRNPEAGHPIEYEVKKEEQGNIENLYTLFTRIPDINFRFELAAERQREVRGRVVDYY